MAWIATYKTHAEHKQPNDSENLLNALIDIWVEFTDGQTTFQKKYEINVGDYHSLEDIQTLIEADITVLNKRKMFDDAFDSIRNKEFPKKAKDVFVDNI